jgi:type IV pilus assembly protein PilZ
VSLYILSTEDTSMTTDNKIIPFVLHVDLANLEELYTAYMPFINGGGLFVPTTQKHNLGDAIMISLTLPNLSQEHLILGTIVWFTPPGAQTGTPTGIGVQFNDTEQNKAISIWIKNVLADYPRSDQPTNTL